MTAPLGLQEDPVQRQAPAQGLLPVLVLVPML